MHRCKWEWDALTLLNQFAASFVHPVRSKMSEVLYNNRIEIFLASLGRHDGEFILNSHHNVIEENNSGITSLIRDLSFPQGSLRNRTRIHSTKGMIWNNRAGGVNVEGYRRDANDVEIRDNETELQFLGTRFVKLTTSGEFNGLQNR
jgi:hypothetical protein